MTFHIQALTIDFTSPGGALDSIARIEHMRAILTEATVSCATLVEAGVPR